MTPRSGWQNKHKQFISETAIKYQGAVFQEEGDAYWIEFPSVTNACFAAMEMHQNLRSLQAGKEKKQRLAIRAVITVGDILYQGSDTMGMTMSLTARLEKNTPADEIYLSHAAWLVLNKAEVQTSFVNELHFKGFEQPEKVYKVEQKHKSRVITNQFIVYTDIRGWSNFTQNKGIEDVESFLFDYHDLLNEICEKYNGIIRNVAGDECFITFSETDALFSTINELCTIWKEKFANYQFGLSIAVHKGNLNIIRSYLYSNDIIDTVGLERLNSFYHPSKESISVIVSNKVKASASGTKWENRFQPVDLNNINNEKFMQTAKEHGAFLFHIEKDL